MFVKFNLDKRLVEDFIVLRVLTLASFQIMITAMFVFDCILPCLYFVLITVQQVLPTAVGIFDYFPQTGPTI